MISLTVNGAQHQFPQTPNVAQLLEQLALQGKRIAVEIADDDAERQRGLMFRDELAAGSGMLRSSGADMSR